MPGRTARTLNLILGVWLVFFLAIVPTEIEPRGFTGVEQHARA